MDSESQVARIVGTRIGLAIARDVIADDLPREWTGLDAQDVDMIPDGVDHGEVEAAARDAYLDRIELAAMVDVLVDRGIRFAGNCAEDVAEDWIDHGFTADTAIDWCDVRVWDAGTAADSRDAGLSPDEVQAAAESLTDGLEDEDVHGRYTDGCPIYAACNGDLTARDAIIYEAQRLASH